MKTVVKPSKRLLCILMTALVLLTAAGCEFSTAKVEDAFMTTSVSTDGVPGEAVESFPANAEILYAAAKLLNAPDHTSVSILWVYVKTDATVADVSVDSGTLANRYIFSTLEPSSELPLGDYRVEFYVESRKEPDATVEFTVVEPEVTIEDAHMTSSMSEGGVPADTIYEVGPYETWYVSAILRNTQPDTTIRFDWKTPDGSSMGDYTLDPTGQSDIYIAGTMQPNGFAPDGVYQAQIYIDDAAEPAATVDFTVSLLSDTCTAPVSGFLTYAQRQSGVSLLYPGDWRMLESSDLQTAAFYPDPSVYYIQDMDEVYTLYCCTLIDSLDSSSTLADIQESWIEKTEEDNLKDYQIIDSSIETVNGRNAAVVVYSWSESGYDLYTFDFLIPSGTDLYYLTYTTTPDEIEALYPQVVAIVRSFDLL